MAFGTSDIPDQSGRVVVVTGSNTGIGYETARALAHAGADVTLACRDTTKADAAAARIRAESPRGAVHTEALDLSDLDSVRAFATRFASTHDRLDLLIANAGVMVPPASKTKQGFELQFGTNHLGHFALALQLLPLVDRTAGSRVVVVSSGAHHMGRIDLDDLQFEKRGYRAWPAYSQSKLANLLFVLELRRRLEAAGSRTLVTAAHPGWTATDLQRSVRASGIANALFAMKPADGALPTLRAAVDPAARSGDYFGPRWFFEMNGPPVAAKKSARAQDASMAEALWSKSEALTGVRFELGKRPSPAVVA
jgi:NAD(P)-dependent dehydrogenase (short-subunit alcohol dehydrogenase family)